MKMIAWHHKGKWLAEPLINVLAKHKLYSKMLAQTHDSGSNNDTCARAMQARLSKIASDENEKFEFDESRDRVRCAGHKIALIVNAGLQALGIKAPPPPLVKSTILGEFPLDEHTLTSISEEDEGEDESGPGKSQACDSNNIEESDSDDEMELNNLPGKEVDEQWYGVIDGPFEELPSDLPATNRNEANAVYLLTLVLDEIARKIGGSSRMLAVFDATCVSMGVKFPRPIPGYGIRWNIKLQCWERLFNAQEVIDQMLRDDQKETIKEKSGKNRNPEVGPRDPDSTQPRGIFNKAYISPEQWKQVGRLLKVLREFQTLTKIFEADAPTGSLVIREYVKLKKSLQDKIDSCESRADPLFPMYHAMLVRVKSYLSEALKSDVLMLATVLHPSWRTDYFQFAFGDNSEEFTAAQGLLESAFDIQKAELNSGKKNDRNDDNSDDGEEDDEDGFRAHKKKVQTRIENELTNYFERVDEPSKAVEKDPHLALEWWKVNASRYPVLSSLARDYLAVCGASCAVERTFSAAADVCGRDRGALKPPTVERSVGARLWSKDGINIDGSEFEDCQRCMCESMTLDKSHRRRKG